MEYLSMEGMVILEWIFQKKIVGDSDWIHIPQDIDQQHAFVNTVTNLLVPLKEGNFLIS